MPKKKSCILLVKLFIVIVTHLSWTTERAVFFIYIENNIKLIEIKILNTFGTSKLDRVPNPLNKDWSKMLFQFPKTSLSKQQSTTPMHQRYNTLKLRFVPNNKDLTLIAHDPYPELTSLIHRKFLELSSLMKRYIKFSFTLVLKQSFVYKSRGIFFPQTYRANIIRTRGGK